ncbi:MAG: hypothetical protein QOH89_2180 [Pseudonocardiales bacterium]|jgi:hypothetical protein|nr:hypothetical protein [Pseudonocardiales bacterium]MDT4941582.1 hypothetical protein [Pseudonocardiales bacterium]
MTEPPAESAARRRRRRRATRAQGAPTAAPPPPPEAVEAVEAAPAKAERKRRPARDGGTDRGLRDLVGAGRSQLGVSGALRGRDVNRPTDEDLAAAERDTVISRRHWKPTGSP